MPILKHRINHDLPILYRRTLAATPTTIAVSSTMDVDHSPLSSAPSSPLWPELSGHNKELGSKGKKVDSGSASGKRDVLDNNPISHEGDVATSEDLSDLSTAPSSPLWPVEDRDTITTSDDGPLSTARTSPTWPKSDTDMDASMDTDTDADNDTISISSPGYENLGDSTEVPATHAGIQRHALAIASLQATRAEMQHHALAIASLQRTIEFPTSFCRTRIQAQNQPDSLAMYEDTEPATEPIRLRNRMRLGTRVGGAEAAEDRSAEAVAAGLVAQVRRTMSGSETKVEEWIRDLEE